MSLIEIVDPSFLKAKLDLVDLSITGLRDALKGAGARDFTTLETDVESISARLDVALSTRLSEATFTGRFPSSVSLSDSIANPATTIIGGAMLGWDPAGAVWERVYTDGSNRLKTQLDSLPNPPHLDVALSTRLADSKIPNPLAQLNRDIGGMLHHGLIVIPSGSPMDITRMPYMIDDIVVTTTESSTAIASPGAKYIIITNKGDVDVLIGINAPVPHANPLKVRARCARIFGFGGVTSVYYRVAAGSTTISICYWN